ncbi:hypothetical protein K493DRAFT_284951 [Basidiobolus meristosporus CBS 931.73]|uniref:Gamma interferon inducible lysosomal thiol reductase n=1 Tax=Basidiobolus meristosporus CBS 931.73 TaxID=1314790 RepID=A0A1Y1Y5C5_9FUNG|nr:hypothetical protein K493DRAFT_284951 [Basidiobolus meristosporus CBS 931.73]|eukprot:ORX93193.1 hypothetical protein K493DRAFT_284951 [Basidiobolus meristosporus CBS 931.73]
MLLKTVLSSCIAATAVFAHGWHQKVPVDLYVMSICPDAVKCEAVFSQVLDQVGDIVDFNINYTGTENANGTFTCKHGEPECRGNRIQLCTRKFYEHRSHDKYQYLDFINCQNEAYKQNGSNENLERCAKKFGYNSNLIAKCADSRLGNHLFSRTLAHSNSLGIKVSCTMHINHELRCIHDGGLKYCPGGFEVSDFVRDICAKYESESPRGRLPQACKALTAA